MLLCCVSGKFAKLLIFASRVHKYVSIYTNNIIHSDWLVLVSPAVLFFLFRLNDWRSDNHHVHSMTHKHHPL